MFDIHYFRKDPRPFFKFAKEIYPGQFQPSPCHKFIKCIGKSYQSLHPLFDGSTLLGVLGCQGVYTISCGLLTVSTDLFSFLGCIIRSGLSRSLCWFKISLFLHEFNINFKNNGSLIANTMRVDDNRTGLSLSNILAVY